MISILNMS